MLAAQRSKGVFSEEYMQACKDLTAAILCIPFGFSKREEEHYKQQFVTWLLDSQTRWYRQTAAS